MSSDSRKRKGSPVTPPAWRSAWPTRSTCTPGRPRRRRRAALNDHALPAMIRPNIRAMDGYVPGEQPRDGAFIKLNTNENPYPPSPKVFEAVRAALTGDRLRKYPDPSGTAFRQTASRVLGVDPDAILIGNGSDDILTIL